MWTSFRRVSALAAYGLLLAATTLAQTAPPGDPVEFIYDDGTPGPDNFGSSSAFVALNEFSPPEFPLELDQVDIMWTAGTVEVGDPYTIFLYEDPDGDFFNGPATHRATIAATVASIDGGTFTSVSFAPVRFEGPGNIFVAYSTGPDIVAAWVAVDPNPSAIGSYVTNWGNHPSVPPIPNPAGGNGQIAGGYFMVRAFGVIADIPVMLLGITVE